MSESELSAGSQNTAAAAQRAIEQVIAFLRMTAIELRRIADRAPSAGDQLAHVAAQLEAEADHLARQIGR